MEKASKAMQQIHGKLTPEKVDETMYVAYEATNLFDSETNICDSTGTSCATKTLSPKKLSTLLLRTLLATRLTIPSSKTSLSKCSRSLLMSRCSRQAACRLLMPYTRCLRRQTLSVSGNQVLLLYPLYTNRNVQLYRTDKRSKRTTKMRRLEDCRLKWQCKPGEVHFDIWSFPCLLV